MVACRLTATAAVATCTLTTAVALFGGATIVLWPHGTARTQAVVELQLWDELLGFNGNSLIYHCLD